MELRIHTGGPRCASSFIQNCLESNYEKLKDNSICYPPDSAFSSDAGNGARLARLLKEKKYQEAFDIFLFFRDFADQHDSNVLVLSSEYFTYLAKDEVKRLVDNALDIGFSLVHFVHIQRDYQSFCWSLYNQTLKSTLYSGSLECFKKDYAESIAFAIEFRTRIESFCNGYCDRAKVQADIFPYTVQISQKVISILSSNMITAETPRAPMNNEYKRNAGYGSRYISALISALNTLPDYRMTSFLKDAISCSAWKTDAPYQLFLGNLETYFDDSFVRDSSNIAACSGNQADFLFIAGLLLKLASSSTIDDSWSGKDIFLFAIAARIFDSCATHSINKESSPGLPSGFNSAVYLLLNPDVLAAGVDPVGHYLTHGQAEGRRWNPNLP